jgi:hypothetical protein
VFEDTKGVRVLYRQEVFEDTKGVITNR